MATKARKPQQLDYPRAEFFIARYSALSEEKQSRYSNVYQMTSLNLTISAAIFTFGLQPSSTASVFFIVPILSMLMGIVVAYNFQTARRLARIQSDIEAEFNLASKDSASQGRIISRFTALFGTGGLFLIVQILASVLGLLKIQQYTTLDIVLIIGDILSVLIVLRVISATSRAIKNEESPAQKAG